MKTVFIAGISGSIGKQALEVLNKDWFIDNFKIVGGSVYSNWEMLKDVIDKYYLKAVALVKESVEVPSIYHDCMIFKGENSVEKAIEYCNADISIIATSGFSGLRHTLKSLEVSKRICLANKESIVSGGNFILNNAYKKERELIPIDSEHSAIFQLLLGESSKPEKIIITASGGALRDEPIDQLEHAPIDKVLKHPVWSMGKRITIDSATMVNKGLEVIEAFHLFRTKNITVAINRESRIHSMVQFTDGVIKMHYGLADMRIPIAFSLSYPQRKYYFDKPDFFSEKIDFHKVDFKRYPALKLALDILGIEFLQNAYNAADEVAVNSYLKGEIIFGDIYRIIYSTVNEIQHTFSYKNESLKFTSLDDILKVDKLSREIAKKYVLEVKK